MVKFNGRYNMFVIVNCGIFYVLKIVKGYGFDFS